MRNIRTSFVRLVLSHIKRAKNTCADALCIAYARPGDRFGTHETTFTLARVYD